MSRALPRVDWRDNTRGLPFASISAEEIKPISKGIDKEAQSAVEVVSDRRQIARPGERK